MKRLTQLRHSWVKYKYFFRRRRLRRRRRQSRARATSLVLRCVSAFVHVAASCLPSFPAHFRPSLPLLFSLFIPSLPFHRVSPVWLVQRAHPPLLGPDSLQDQILVPQPFASPSQSSSLVAQLLSTRILESYRMNTGVNLQQGTDVTTL